MKKLLLAVLFPVLALAQIPVTLQKNQNSGTNPNQLTAASSPLVIGNNQTVTFASGSVLTMASGSSFTPAPGSNLVTTDGVYANPSWITSLAWSKITGAPTPGTVSSVGLTAPAVFSVSGSPVTGTGTLVLSFATGQPANYVLATPNGSTGILGARALVVADIPSLTLAKISDAGTAASKAISFFQTPQTSAAGYGITNGSNLDAWAAKTVPTTDVFASGTQGKVLATPAVGSGAPTMRALLASDLPAVTISANSLLGNNTGSAAVGTSLNAASVKTLLAISAGDVSGLGNAATRNVGVTAGTVAAGDDARFHLLFTTLGQTIYAGASSGNPTILDGNTTTTRKFYRQTGTGTISAAPAWDTLVNGDIPTALTGKSYNGVTTSGSGTLSNSGTTALTGFTGTGTSSGTNTGDQTITLTGAVTGSGTGSFATTLANSIVSNANVNAAAAIALSKLAATTVSRALVSDGSGIISPATTTATEIGYVNGVTSAIQTQLNGKESNLTFSAPLARSVNAISIPVATGSVNGYLSSTDWTTFNAKQAAGNYVTALTGDVSASGPGAVAATLATVNGTVGTFGSSTSIPTFTVNGKGLITAASGNAVVAPAGTLTGANLASNVTSAPGLANVVQAEYFGADPTGANDSTDALKTAETYFSAIGGGTLVFKAGGTYKFSRYAVGDNGPSIHLIAGVNYEGNGATLLQTANAGFMGNVPIQTARATITADVAIGDTQLTVDTTANLTAGDVIGIRLGNNAYDSAETSLFFFSSVVSIDSGTTLHIDRGAPQAMVVGSTTSANRAILRFRSSDNPVYQNQFVRNFKFIQSGAGNVEQGLSLVCTRNVTVENIYAENPGAGAVLMAYGFNNRVSNVYVGQSIQQSSQASKGRGLNVWNSVDCTFSNIKIDAFQGVAIFVESYCRNLLFDGVVATNNWLAFSGTARGSTDIFAIGQQSFAHFNNLVINGAGTGQTVFGNGGTPATTTFSNVTVNTTAKIKGSFNLEGFSGGFVSFPLDGYTLLYSQLKRVTQTVRLTTGLTDNVPTVKPPTGYVVGAWYWINDATGVLGSYIIGAGTVPFTPSTAGQRVAILSGDYGTDYPLNAPGTREFHLYTGTVNSGTNLSVEWEYIPYTVDDRQNAPVFTASAAESMSGVTLPTNVTGSSLTSVGTVTTGTWSATPVTGTFGGTGVNNGAKTITLGGNLTTSGAFNTAITITGTTAITLPTSGTLLANSGSVGHIVSTSSTSLDAYTATTTGASGYIQSVWTMDSGGTPHTGNVGLSIGTGFFVGTATNDDVVLRRNLTAKITITSSGVTLADSSITGAGALTFTAGGSNTDITLVPNGTGRIVQSRSLASGNNVRIFNNNTSSAGFTDIINQNDASKYIRTVTGGSATGSTFFGVTTANSGGIVGDVTNMFFGALGDVPVVFGTNNAEVFRFTSSVVTFAKPTKVPSYIVSGLPSAATVGAFSMAAVTDASVPVVGSAVVGGGAVKAAVMSNGSTWTVFAIP